MKYTYFNPVPATKDAAKKAYKTLVFQHHPDRGGDTRTMQDINAEYAALIVEMEFENQYSRQRAAHKEGRKTVMDYVDADEIGQELADMITSLLNLDMQNVTIELIGLWIWVTGETKPHAAKLGKRDGGLGLNWAHKKQAWSYAGCPSFHTGKSLEQIRANYGSTVYSKAGSRKDEETTTAGAVPANV